MIKVESSRQDKRGYIAVLAWIVVSLAAGAFFMKTITPAEETIQTIYPVWIPSHAEKVMEVRNYIHQSGGFISGGTGGIGNLELLVSKEYFQQHSAFWPYVFVSVVKDPPGTPKYIIRYLGLESREASFAWTYEETLWAKRASYNISSAQLTDEGVIFTYDRDLGGVIFLSFFIVSPATGLAIYLLAGLVALVTQRRT
jgi:hypothetical protein